MEVRCWETQGRHHQSPKHGYQWSQAGKPRVDITRVQNMGISCKKSSLILTLCYNMCTVSGINRISRCRTRGESEEFIAHGVTGVSVATQKSIMSSKNLKLKLPKGLLNEMTPQYGARSG